MTETGCNNELTPVVMVHGFLASGDTYEKQAMRFTTNGYCRERIFAFDWNSLSNDDKTPLLDQFIDDVLRETGAEQVDLLGHSAGGGLGYSYLSDSLRSQKVRRYVHLASGANSGPAGPAGEIPTLNIWSDGDEVVSSSDIPGAENLMLIGADHYEAATSEETFSAIYAFLNDGESPTTTEILPEMEIALSGKILTFAENNPTNGANLQIFEVNPATGERLSTAADAEFTADAAGNWGPFAAEAETTYEFFVSSSDTAERPVHYYREAFIRSNHLIYLRTVPPPTTFAGTLLNILPKEDEESVLAVFSASQAVIHQRDQLTVNNRQLATEALASADQTTIAFFIFDTGDNMTSEDAHPLFLAFSFLNAVDIFIPSTPASAIELTFNGRNLVVRNWPSETGGVVVPVFD